MSVHVLAHDLGGAWLSAFEALVAGRGDLVNLTVTVTTPLIEDVGVRGAVEAELARRRARGAEPTPQSVHTVANTIFPISLYAPGRPNAADRFFTAAVCGQRSRHGTSARWGTYVGRLVDYPGPKGRANQLELVVKQLKSAGAAWKDRYELAVTVPDYDGPADPEDLWLDTPRSQQGQAASVRDLRVIADTRSDHHARGGPCLAHLSLTLFDGRLNMTALYRRQSYVARAYGNFVGLARLLHFLATEGGHEVGELMIVASHAEIDGGRRQELLRAAHQRQGRLQPVEVQARPFGASWRDLELPAMS